MNSSIQWIVLYIGAAVLIGILVIILVLIRIRERNEQKEREVWRFLPDRKAMGKLVL